VTVVALAAALITAVLVELAPPVAWISIGSGAKTTTAPGNEPPAPHLSVSQLWWAGKPTIRRSLWRRELEPRRGEGVRVADASIA
jgi:hypothetical protein